MRKLFLIPLMTLVCSVMAFATVRSAGTFDQLRSAIAAAEDGDEIQLTADINYGKVGYASNLNITKSITLNGLGHTLTGAGQRQEGNGNYSTIWINFLGSEFIDVTIKDIKMINPISTVAYSYKCVETRGKIGTITMQNVELHAVGTPISVGGNETTKATFVIENCKFVASTYHPIIVYNPIDMTIRDSYLEGWASIYFKGYQDSKGTSNSAQGARGSKVKAFNTTFNSYNSYSSGMNGFGTFVCEDDGIAISLENCATNSLELGSMNQAVLLLSSWAPKTHRTQPVTLNVSGDNSYINGNLLSDAWSSGSWVNTSYQVKKDTSIVSLTNPLTIECTGGTYAFNPAEYGWLKNATIVDPTEKYAQANIDSVHIPEGYEVKKIETQQDEQTTTLYRVRQIITGSTALNDNAGQNPTADIKVTDNVTLANEETIAEYVEVKGGESTDPKVTVTVPEGKTLEVTNGLDVTGNAEVVVEAGSTVVVGEGGIISEKPENIVIGADENGAASLLLDPKVIVNTTPNLTVKMKAKSIGWLNVAGDKWYFWHRFALPIQECTTWVKNPNKSTYVFGWNYSANNWEQLSALTQMEPFKGYTLSADYENLGDVEYTFTGQLAGNTNNLLQFERNGFNFFGNSYTGYIDILALVDQIMGDNKIDGTVWMWYQENQSYVAIPLQALRDDPTAFDSWMREVAPMQTFILKQNGSENASAELNYASAVWGNPRYGNAAPAPRRAAANDNTNMRIVVTAENGKSDFVMFTENAKFTDAFEKGYDGEKYMNENALNMYATVDGADYTAVATDNLEGKTLSINTVESVNYTMSFAKVNTEEYAIRDNVTGAVIAIENGATYEFAAQPNSLVENRFEIVPVAKVPTAIENTEVKANVKGIYTIMGQYLGEDFDVLPAGIYVVNGVKIVK